MTRSVRLFALCAWLCACSGPPAEPPREPPEPPPIARPRPTEAPRQDPPAAVEATHDALAPGELQLAPYPLAVHADAPLSARPDPAVPTAMVVHGACDVRVIEAHDTLDGPVNGASLRTLIAQTGATFSRETIADARWALEFRAADGGRRSVHHGLVADGHTYLCRGEFASEAEQRCGSALCESMRVTSAAAAPDPAGPFVAHCFTAELCAHTRAASRRALTATCEEVHARVGDGPCPERSPDGFARTASCETADHALAWVHYAVAGATDLDTAAAQCALLHGTFTAR